MKTRNLRFVVTLLLAAALGGCRAGVPKEAPPRPVRIEAVSAAADSGGLRYSATIQPHEQVSVAFKASGYVRELGRRKGADGRVRPIQQGDEVAKGTLVALVNDAEARERVNQAKAQVVEAAVSLERARTEAGRAERLFAAQSLTRPDYDAARTTQATAEARLDGAKAQLESAELALRDCSLVAPFDGVVLARQAEVGTLAAPGTVGFTLADLGRVKAVFGVPDRLADRARIGMPLSVTSDAFGATAFPGKITAVSPSADPQSRVFTVEVTIDNAKRRLKAGMIASVEVPAASGAGGAPLPMVPLAAIVKANAQGGYAVFLADGNESQAVARSREVTLGEILGNRVSVAAGLQPGDKVIVSGASLLRNGEPVRIIPGREEG
jgi:multidrug efflux system membrane fusion protein